MLASVFAAIFVTFSGTFIAVLLFYQSPLWQQVVAQETLNLTPQIREEMRKPTDHKDEITTWLLNFKDGLEDPEQFRKTGFSFSLQKKDLEINLIVSDKNGNIIANVPENPKNALNDIFSPETQKLFVSPQ